MGPDNEMENVHRGGQEYESDHRESDLKRRERNLLQREIELPRRENEILRASSNDSILSTASRTTSIQSISELVGEYSGWDEDFERWRT